LPIRSHFCRVSADDSKLGLELDGHSHYIIKLNKINNGNVNMGGIAYDLAWLVSALFGVVKFGLLVYIILGLLVSFAVVNGHNQLVYMVMSTLSRIFEPMLRPIRNILPNLGGLDISPIFLFIALEFASRILVRLLISLA